MVWLGTNGSWSLRLRLIENFLGGVAIGLAGYFSSYWLSLLVKTIQDNQVEDIKRYLFLLVAVSVGLVAIKFVWRRTCEFVGKIIENNIKKYYYRKLFYKNYDWHIQNSVGYFSSMLDKVVARIHTWNWAMAFDYISSFTLGACFLVYTWQVSPLLFIYFFTCLAVLIIMTRVLYVSRAKLLRENAAKSRDFQKLFVDFLYNIRSIKKLNLLKFTQNKIDEKATQLERKNTQMMTFNAYQYLLTESLIQLQFLVPLVYFVYQLIKTGDGIEIIVMLTALQGKMAEIGRRIMAFMHEIATSQKDFELLAEHMKDDQDTATTKMTKHTRKQWREIRFKDTYFTFYKDKTKFEHHVDDFVINRGDHVAVVGKSGEGKSTFLNLLTRQYNVKSGAITLDDVNYTEVSQKFFDDNMTYVSQDIELFNLSLYDNITIGKHVSRQQLQKLIDGCCLNELIERMNGDMDTNIGEKGIKVSGGEKQRINLARGLLLGRDILILDEITANLDPATTKHIWEFIFSEYGNHTIIAISHEPELLKHVNKKIMFRGGCGKCAK